MTKKDYIKIAEAVRVGKNNYRGSAAASQAIDDLADDLSVIFKQDKPHFDEKRFRAACKTD